jgi:hypothetical protein
MSEPPSLLVAPCSHAAATHAVMTWHYSHAMPAPPYVRFGVWESGSFVGAVIFGRGASSHLMEPYGLDKTQGAELVRVALRAHHAPVSQIVSAAVAQLKRSSPGLRLLVSFADPVQGHRGGIYQAMGWIYTGQSSASVAYRDPATGRLYHNRVVSKTGLKVQYGTVKRCHKTDDLEPVRLPGKHRYLLPLDKGMRRQIVKLSKPYPRGRSVNGDAPVGLTGETGSIPVDRSTTDKELSHEDWTAAEADSAASAAR